MYTKRSLWVSKGESIGLPPKMGHQVNQTWNATLERMRGPIYTFSSLYSLLQRHLFIALAPRDCFPGIWRIPPFIPCAIFYRLNTSQRTAGAFRCTPGEKMRPGKQLQHRGDNSNKAKRLKVVCVIIFHHGVRAILKTGSRGKLIQV